MPPTPDDGGTTTRVDSKHHHGDDDVVVVAAVGGGTTTAPLTFGELLEYALENAPHRFRKEIIKHKKRLHRSASTLLHSVIDSFAQVLRCLKRLKTFLYHHLDTVTYVKYKFFEVDIEKHMRVAFEMFI